MGAGIAQVAEISKVVRISLSKSHKSAKYKKLFEIHYENRKIPTNKRFAGLCHSINIQCPAAARADRDRGCRLNGRGILYHLFSQPAFYREGRRGRLRRRLLQVLYLPSASSSGLSASFHRILRETRPHIFEPFQSSKYPVG